MRVHPDLVIVSNRLPVSVARERGGLVFSPSDGGLARGLASVLGPKTIWVGWPGIASEDLSDAERLVIIKKLAGYHCYPVFLSRQTIKRYYDGFSNDTLWPLFHYFPQSVRYKTAYWTAYKEANEAFAVATAEVAGEKSRVWVHDYHLMLLPAMLRQRLPKTSIGFFMHIPFPSYELFRLLPNRQQLLAGVLGADLIGFHTYDYVRHFLSSALQIGDYEQSLSVLNIGKRRVKVDVFPMGIDFDRFASAPDTKTAQTELRKLKAATNNQKIILSVDRLDYTKGILERLEAFETFLAAHESAHGKVTMIMVAVPSRTGVQTYRQLRESVEHTISHINGTFGRVGWTPVQYMFRSISFEHLAALYRSADVMLVSPLRDGMNLVAKEYVAAKGDYAGVLILSEMAGAASELTEALPVNPYDRDNIADAINRALHMPEGEQHKRLTVMQQRLRRYTVDDWATDFLHELSEHTRKPSKEGSKLLTAIKQRDILRAYKKAARRLILFDYDGTLVPFVDNPEDALPDPALFELLQELCTAAGNQVAIISGRDKRFLERWLGNLPLVLVAEHGAAIRSPGKRWQAKKISIPGWKTTIRTLWQPYLKHTPGALIEEKVYGMVWHFRKVAAPLANLRLEQLKKVTEGVAGRLGLGVYVGNKVLEVKPLTTSKQAIVNRWLTRSDWDFVLMIGDDYTDEDVFATLPDSAVSIKVGSGATAARFRLGSVEDVRHLLGGFIST